MRRGLVSGKFVPLHRGHQLMIEAALAQVDELTVVVYDTPVDDPAAKLMPVEKRAKWVADLYPEVHNVIWRPDPGIGHDRAEVESSAWSQIYADDISFLGPFTHVFANEGYGIPFAAALGAEPVRIDEHRELMPISGTEVRSDLYKYRAFLDPLVYRSLIQKVVFVGTESTGKSTLAATMAEKYNTSWIHEFGRELWAEQDGGGTFPDFLKIGRNQYRREQAGALHARRFLFCDTNAWTTLHWSLMYYGSADQRLYDLADETMDDYIWFLCDNDFDWVQDGLRELEGEKALKLQEALIDDLDNRKVPYWLLSGTLESRIERVQHVLTLEGWAATAPLYGAALRESLGKQVA